MKLKNIDWDKVENVYLWTSFVAAIGIYLFVVGMLLWDLNRAIYDFAYLYYSIVGVE